MTLGKPQVIVLAGDAVLEFSSICPRSVSFWHDKSILPSPNLAVTTLKGKRHPYLSYPLCIIRIPIFRTESRFILNKLTKGGIKSCSDIGGKLNFNKELLSVIKVAPT